MVVACVALVLRLVVMLWILLLVVIAPTGGSHLEYLKGVRRLVTDGYTDYYFSCSLVGDFLRWEYNSEPLSGFGIGDAGRVVVITGPMYEYTATLLSSQLDPESNQQRLDSVLVLSFVGYHPSLFEVTCSSNSEFTTANVTGMRGSATSTNSSNGMVVLEHIVSSEIVHNKNKTHIFICGTQNDQLYYEVQRDLSIGFTEHDEIGEDRTVLSQDGNLVNTQGVLFAQLPYNKTSLLFVTENSDVTVTCYFGTTEAVLNNKESTDPLPTSTHIASVTITTSDALVSHTTTVIPSATYETDYAVITGSSNIVAATITSVIGLGILIIIIIIMVAVLVIRMKKRVKYICEEASHTVKIDLEIYCKEDQPNPPTLEDTPSIETSPGIISSEEVLIKSIPGENKVLKDLESLSSPTEDLSNIPEENTSEDSVYGSSSISSDKTSRKTASGQTISSESGSSLPLKREDPPMEAGPEEMVLGGGKSKQKHSDESASSSGYTSDRIQNPVEESGSGEEPLRICESSAYLFGHESAGTELVKSFGCLQELQFIVAEELKVDYWSDNACPVYLPYIKLADSYSLKNAFSSRSPDIVVCEESPDVVATGNTFKMIRVHSKDDNIDVTKKDVCVIDITEEGIYNTDDVHDNSNSNVTVEYAHVTDDVYNDAYCGFFMEEYEDAQSDTRVTAENNVLDLLTFKPLSYNLAYLEVNSVLTSLFHSLSYCSYCCNQKMRPEFDLVKEVALTEEEWINGAYKVDYFEQCFLPITMTEAELRICQSIGEIFHVIQVVFRMVQTLYIKLYYHGLLWFYALTSKISGVPLDRGGTLHVPIVGTSSRWGRT